MALGLIIPLIILALAVMFFVSGRQRAMAISGADFSLLHSKPAYHGGYFAIVALAPAVILGVLWLALFSWASETYVIGQLGAAYLDIPPAEQSSFLRSARALAEGRSFGDISPVQERAAALFSDFRFIGNTVIAFLAALLIAAGVWYGFQHISLRLRARQFVERSAMSVLIAASAVAIFTTLGIVLSLVFESYRFFEQVPFFDFLFGTHWSPQSAFRGAGVEEGAVNTEVFGAIPIFAGTMLITLIAISVAAPIGLMSAIYLSDYASARFRAVAKPLLEVLAGIPTVVYGFFAALTVAPFFRGAGEGLGLTVSSESALAAGLVMGIMIIPFVSSLSDDVINAVPQSLRDGSAGLGATKSETIRKVILPAALPGIVSALMLAISRAIGETMIVVMAAGLAANLTANPLEAVTTVTVQIVTLLVGDQEFDSAKTLAAFALGLVLFCVTLTLNVIALRVIKKYQEQYD